MIADVVGDNSGLFRFMENPQHPSVATVLAAVCKIRDQARNAEQLGVAEKIVDPTPATHAISTLLKAGGCIRHSI